MKVKVKNELEEFYRRISRKGLKTSQKRSSVIKYFLKADRHFTVEELYNEMRKINPKISYSTVYRTLKLLTRFGLANICRFEGDKTRFEPNHKAEQHHDHLICISCGRIIEFTNKKIEKFQQGVANRHNFLIQYHELKLYGLCKDCQRKEKK